MKEKATKGTNNASGPIITLDYDAYAHYLEDSNLTEDQKREFLQALWSIICDFVALGFNVHPAQQVQNACGKLPEKSGNLPISAMDLVDCRGQFQSNQFNDAAGGIISQAVGRIRQ